MGEVPVGWPTFQQEAVSKCHLHSKPLLSCKFCRKYKMAVHQQAKLVRIHELVGVTSSHLKTNTLEMTSNANFNLNPMLKENILASEYFKSLYQFDTVAQIIAEADQYIDHVEPYVTGHSNIPSTFICCMYKLCLLRCTRDELLTLLEHENLFVRALGYVWLRFVCPADQLWGWFESAILESRPFQPSGAKKSAVVTTFGEFLESLLKDDRYFTTPLPRLPAKVKTICNLQLQPIPKHRRRKIKNLRHKVFRPGNDVLACHGGEWKEGVFVERYDDDISHQPLAMVKFEDQGLNEAPVDFGLIIKLSGDDRKRRVW